MKLRHRTLSPALSCSFEWQIDTPQLLIYRIRDFIVNNVHHKTSKRCLFHHFETKRERVSRATGCCWSLMIPAHSWSQQIIYTKLIMRAMPLCSILKQFLYPFRTVRSRKTWGKLRKLVGREPPPFTCINFFVKISLQKRLFLWRQNSFKYCMNLAWPPL